MNHANIIYTLSPGRLYQILSSTAALEHTEESLTRIATKIAITSSTGVHKMHLLLGSSKSPTKVRAAALSALSMGPFSDQESTYYFVMHLHMPQNRMVATALGSLRRIGHKMSIPALDRLLESDCPEVVAEAIAYAGHLHPNYAFHTVNDALDNDNDTIRFYALSTFTSCYKPAIVIPRLRELLPDEDNEQVRDTMEYSLERLYLQL